MTISPLGGTTATGTTADIGSATATSPTSGFDTLGKDTFLKLMVAQLRNQDPMNPTDSTQFLAQTAQFTSLEKLEDVASQSQQALAAQMAFGASGLVGKQVTYTSDAGTQVSGSVSSVTFTANGPVLTVGAADVPINSVVSVGSSTPAA
ncbi:MAG: flagellar hook capping FlgD N-terminal domain-containing protein [Nocardioides sp.]